MSGEACFPRTSRTSSRPIMLQAMALFMSLMASSCHLQQRLSWFKHVGLMRNVFEHSCYRLVCMFLFRSAVALEARLAFVFRALMVLRFSQYLSQVKVSKFQLCATSSVWCSFYGVAQRIVFRDNLF